MRLSPPQLQRAGISCTLPAKQRLQEGWWGFPGPPAVGPAAGRHSADIVWHRWRWCASLVPGILESPEVLTVFQHSVFQFYSCHPPSEV